MCKLQRRATINGPPCFYFPRKFQAQTIPHSPSLLSFTALMKAQSITHLKSASKGRFQSKIELLTDSFYPAIAKK
jgi:hypothetical protein